MEQLPKTEHGQEPQKIEKQILDPISDEREAQIKGKIEGLAGKTIKKAEVDMFGIVYLNFEDGSKIMFDGSQVETDKTFREALKGGSEK